MEELIEQLKTYCDCAGEFTDLDVIELVNVVSLLTCYKREATECSTFLLSDRKEFIKLACIDFTCKFRFVPWYRPFKEDSFEFRLHVIDVENGTEDISEPLPYMYIESEKSFFVSLDETDECKCGCIDPCNPCGKIYTLEVNYVAGYEVIPDCVLPVFCDILQMIHAKRSCDCEDCGCDVTVDPMDSIKYKKGDLITAKLQNGILAELIINGYRGMLGSMSLCYNVEDEPWIVKAR